MPKDVSELKYKTDTFISFGSKKSTLRFEVNRGQSCFAGSPSPSTDHLLIAMDGEEWFLSKSDAQTLAAWLTEAAK